MKKILIFILVTLYTSAIANQLNISLENKSNYTFEDYLFKDINSSEHLSKTNSFNNVNINGNFNDMIGASYNNAFVSNDDKFNSKEIYLGTLQTKYFGYKKTTQDIKYNTRKTTKKGTTYTFFNILTVNTNDFKTEHEESFLRKINGTDTNLTKNVHREYNLKIRALSTENLYSMIKDNNLQDKDYFYGVAVSQHFKSRFRLYGLVIASYENYDYTKGSAYYYDDNGTKMDVKDTSDADENKLVAVDGRYKGIGYGYKLTAEAYWDNLSIFITSYMKTITLTNDHSGVLKQSDPAQVILKDKIKFSNRYTTFGLRYRF